MLQDIRHNKFENSLIGIVETSLGQGPIYFNCYPNKTVSLMDRNILDSLFLNIHFHGLDMKEGSIPAALIYRIQYKVMNTCASRVLLKPQKRETTLFITDMTKANVFLPRTIKWDEVTLPEKWVIDKVTPSVPRPAPTIEQIKQDNSGKDTLRKDFYSPENQPQRRWFFQHFKDSNRKQIQDKFIFCEFVERVKINVLFFDWFHAYTIREYIDYPWKQDIIGDPTTNAITNWQIKDGEFIQSKLPPTTQYRLPKVKDSHDKPVMATPFKTKDVNKEVTSKDIKSLMEQTNYTNKYLQVLGESIKTKTIPKQKSPEEPPSNIPIEKSLFKPFKISDNAKQKIRELRKHKSLIEGVGDNNSELLNKLDSLLRVIPETPQPSEGTSKMVTRSTSKLINVINEDSDQNSENTTDVGSVSEKYINPINFKHWKTPSKLNFKIFSANNIYEWNIDVQTEYNIMNTLQHMTMVAMAYETSHECPEETIIDILSLLMTIIKRIPDAVNTLIFTIAQHFIGDPSLWKDRSAKLLLNLKCRTLADFRWYRDTFLTTVYTMEDSQQPFWKEKFLAGLPRSLGDKVRDKIRSQSVNGDITYESLTYGQLISYVQKVALKICQDNKIQRQLAKEKAQTKRDLGSFCEQFGLPACPKQKKKQNLRKESHENKTVHKKRFPRRRYSHKPSTSKETKTPKPKIKPKITCYNCGKQCRISKYYDQPSSTDDDERHINTLTREQDLLSPEKNIFLEKLKKTLETKPRQKDFITNNKFDSTSGAPQILYLTISLMNSYRKRVMPPRATGTSLRGGRSSGKIFKLALPETTVKKSSSTSSGSPT
ncbi:polyprotein [Glycine soja]